MEANRETPRTVADRTGCLLSLKQSTEIFFFFFKYPEDVCVCVCVFVYTHYQVCAHSPLRISWAVSGWQSHLCQPQKAGCRIRRYKGLHDVMFFTCIDLFKKDFIQPDWRHTSAHCLLRGPPLEWQKKVKVKDAQSCPTLCMEFSRPEYWSG